MPSSPLFRALAAAAATTLAAIVIVAIVSLPGTTGGLSVEVAAAMDRSGVRHPVTAVLLEFRAWDTLLEVGVLLLAVLGARLLHGATGATGVAEHVELPLTWLIRLVVPVLVLTAGHVLLQGASAPGGAFQAGALLAAAAVLLELGGHATVARLPDVLLRGLWITGLAAFLLAGLSGLLGGALLMELPRSTAGGWILFIETAISIAIGASLATLFVAARPAGIRA
jgi:multisubunit Na+/H+ antiporter MnhB subunit